MGSRSERRLSAILVADIVGYSKLIDSDEASTLQALKACRETLIAPGIAEHRGRIVKTTGDGFIAEFGSVVDAVQFAISLQKGVAEPSGEISGDVRLVFRIGINLGDVVVDGDDILGDGINVAARLEPLCPPGGVIMSGPVFDQLQGKIAVPIEFAGEHPVKNIKKPVRTYIVRLKGMKPGWLFRARRGAERLRMPIAVAAVCCLAIGLGAILQPDAVRFLGLTGRVTDQAMEKPTAAGSAASGSQLPMLAVMPFKNLTNDPDLAYFSEGTTENLAMTIGQSPYIRVAQISDQPAADDDLSSKTRDIGARYVLTGSVQRGTSDMRIIAELLDASDGRHLWSSRFDRSSTNPFAVQDEIAGAVIDAISGERGVIMQQLHENALGTDAVSIGEYDYYLRGHAAYLRETKESTEKAIAIWTEGLRQFPESALLKVKLAWGHDQLYYLGVSGDGPADLAKALSYATDGLAGDNVPQLAQALGHWVLCNVHGDAGNWELASPECRRTIELMPNDPYVRHGLAWFPISEGKLDEAADMLASLSPQAPNAKWGYGAYTWLLFARKDYETCIEAADQAPQPTLFFSIPFKAACLAALGRKQEAEQVIDRLMAENQDVSVSFFKTYHGTVLTEVVDREADMLRRAGLRDDAA